MSAFANFLFEGHWKLAKPTEPFDRTYVYVLGSPNNSILRMFNAHTVVWLNNGGENRIRTYEIKR